MHPARAVIIGLLLGALPALFLDIAIKVSGDMANRPMGVTLTPVIVLAKPLAPGAVLTMDDLTQRSIPEVMVTSSIVKPDSASYIVNQPLAVPLVAGEAVSWFAFDTVGSIEGKRPSTELIEACSAEMGRRNIATSPSTVAALRTSVLEGAR